MSTATTATTTTTTTQVQPTSTTLKASSTTSANRPRSANDNDADAEEVYDEIEIEDMTYDPKLEIYHYPCPCGDRFEIYIGSLRDGEDIAVCPGCSLTIRVIFDVDDLPGKDG